MKITLVIYSKAHSWVYKTKNKIVSVFHSDYCFFLPSLMQHNPSPCRISSREVKVAFAHRSKVRLLKLGSDVFRSDLRLSDVNSSVRRLKLHASDPQNALKSALNPNHIGRTELRVFAVDDPERHLVRVVCRFISMWAAGSRRHPEARGWR